MSLADYAAAHPVVRGRPCWVCTSVPPQVREEIDTARRQRSVSVKVMAAYLRDRHDLTEATAGKLNNHFGHVRP